VELAKPKWNQQMTTYPTRIPNFLGHQVMKIYHQKKKKKKKKTLVQGTGHCAK
jgi:hypothetical protein